MKALAAVMVALPLLVAGQGTKAPPKPNAPSQEAPLTPPPAPSSSVASAAATPAAAPPNATQRRVAQRNRDRYDDTFRRYSKRYFGAAFDWHWFKAQGMAESGLDSAARSSVGARGIMQLMPSTFNFIQSKRPEFTNIDDPEWNIAAGIMHDRYLWRLWDGKVGTAERFNFMFASYNAGEQTIGRAADSARVAAGVQQGAVEWQHVEQIAPKVPRWRYRETLGYVRTIDKNYATLKRQR